MAKAISTQDMLSGLNSFNVSHYLAIIGVGKKILYQMHYQEGMLYYQFLKLRFLVSIPSTLYTWRMKTLRRLQYTPLLVALSYFNVLSSSKSMNFASPIDL